VRSTQQPALSTHRADQPQGIHERSHDRYSRKNACGSSRIHCIRRCGLGHRIGIASESPLEGWRRPTGAVKPHEPAWEAYQTPIRRSATGPCDPARSTHPRCQIASTLTEAARSPGPRSSPCLIRIAHVARTTLRTLRADQVHRGLQAEHGDRYRSHVFSTSDESPLKCRSFCRYSDKSPTDGRQVLLRNFDANFARDPRLFVTPNSERWT